MGLSQLDSPRRPPDTARMSVDLRTSLNGPSPIAFRHNPGLDGVRGLGIMIVLFGHYSAGMSDWAKTRFFGVSITIDLFFVLSGYLITALLLEEWSRSNSISMRNFYVRRGLRLLPALYVFLAVVLVFAFATDWLPVSPKLALAEVGSAGLYVYPAVLIAKGDQAFLFHLWTLSVEEWFYFLWPALLLVVGLRPGLPSRLRLVVWSLGAFVVGCFLLRAIGNDDGLSRLVGALRPDSLVYGTLLAFMMRKLQDVSVPRFRRFLDIIGPLGMVGFVWFSWFATFPRPAGISEAAFHDLAFRSWNYRLGIICAFLTVLHVVNHPAGSDGARPVLPTVPIPGRPVLRPVPLASAAVPRDQRQDVPEQRSHPGGARHAIGGRDVGDRSRGGRAQHRRRDALAPVHRAACAATEEALRGREVRRPALSRSGPNRPLPRRLTDTLSAQARADERGPGGRASPSESIFHALGPA